MKILFLNNRIPFPPNDGGNIATLQLIKGLHKAGHEIHLHALNTLKHFQDPQHLSAWCKVTAVKVDTKPKFIPALLALAKSLPYNIIRFNSNEYENKLIEIIEQNDFDLIQIEGSYMGLYLKVIRQHFKGKVVLRCHNIEYKIWLRLADSENNLLKSLYFKHLARKIKLFEEKLFVAVDAIVPITEVDAKTIIDKRVQVPIQVIPAGIDLEEYPLPKIKVRKEQIGFIGSMEWGPNLQGISWFVEKVWPLVHQQLPNISLHLAGKNPPAHLPWIKEPGIHFHGMVPDAQAFLNDKAIIIVPLLSGSGMRIKIIEAMALKKAIVSTRVGAEGILIKDDLDISLKDLPADFAKQIIDWIKEPEKREKIAENARINIEKKYQLKVLIKQLQNFYQSL